MKILIVEDNFVSRRLLSVTLTKLGHTIITAEDGKTAYYQFTEHHPDIIISDWMMPEMDGLELCRTIRLQKHEQYPYFILLTALTSKKHFLEGMD